MSKKDKKKKKDKGGTDYSQRKKGQSKREYLAEKSGGKLNYKSGDITVKKEQPQRKSVAKPQLSQQEKQQADDFIQKNYGIKDDGSYQVGGQTFQTKQPQPVQRFVDQTNPISVMTDNATKKYNLTGEQKTQADEFLEKLKRGDYKNEISSNVNQEEIKYQAQNPVQDVNRLFNQEQNPKMSELKPAEGQSFLSRLRAGIQQAKDKPLETAKKLRQKANDFITNQNDETRLQDEQSDRDFDQAVKDYESGSIDAKEFKRKTFELTSPKREREINAIVAFMGGGAKGISKAVAKSTSKDFIRSAMRGQVADDTLERILPDLVNAKTSKEVEGIIKGAKSAAGVASFQKEIDTKILRDKGRDANSLMEAERQRSIDINTKANDTFNKEGLKSDLGLGEIKPLQEGVNQIVPERQLTGKPKLGTDRTAQMRVPSATGEPSRLVSDVSYNGIQAQGGKNVKQRGFIESIKNNPETSSDLAKKVEGSYEVKHNKPLQEKSQRTIFNNITEAERIAKDNIGDEGVIMGNELVKHYDSIAINAKKTGDIKTFDAAMDKAVNVVENQARNLTEAGRTVQAASTISKLSPEGIIRYVKKVAKDVGSDVKIPNDKMFGFIRQAEDIQKILDPRERAFKLFDLVDDIASNVPMGGKDKLIEALNLPRSIMATADLSAPFRQGIFTAAKNPVKFVKNFGKMFKYAFSEKAYRGMKADIITSPNYNLYVKHKLPITDIAAGLTGREERFMSNLGEKIPLFGKLSRGSNRAYTGFLNKMRVDLFDDFVKTGELNKIKDQKFLDDAAKFVGAATGRGELGRFEDAAKLLNTTFFSPRLMASRMSLINPIYYAKLHPTVRKEALKSLAAFVGTGSGVLALAELNGADVETNPRSADFGKIKIGNTRYDIWGGFQQYARLIGQLTTGEKISTITGKQSTLGEGYNAPTRESIAMDFLKSKEAPIVSFLTRAAQGEKFGEKFNLPAELIDRFIPMIASDAFDLMKEKGISGLGMAIPGAFGVGSQTYGDQIPMNTKTPTGRESIKWRSAPGLGETIFNKITGKSITDIPEDQQGTLREERQAESLRKIELDKTKAEVLETGEPKQVGDTFIYLEDGIVKSSDTESAPAKYKFKVKFNELKNENIPQGELYDRIDSMSPEEQSFFNDLKKEDERLKNISPYTIYDNPTSQKGENTRTFKERLNTDINEAKRFLDKLDAEEKQRILNLLDNKGNEEYLKKYNSIVKTSFNPKDEYKSDFSDKTAYASQAVFETPFGKKLNAEREKQREKELDKALDDKKKMKAYLAKWESKTI